MKVFALVNHRVFALSLSIAMMFSCLGTSHAAIEEAEEGKDRGLFGLPLIPKNTVFKNFYGGVGSGAMRSNSPRSNDDGSVPGFDSDKTGGVGRTFIGYEFNKYLGVEAGYDYLGKSKFEGVSTGGPSWSAGPVSAEHEAQGGSLSAVVRMPVTDRLTLIGTAGTFWWQSKETFIDGGVKTVENENGQDYTFSGGIEYDIGKKDRFVYRAEVQKFVVDPTSYDITAGTFSIVYRFP